MSVIETKRLLIREMSLEDLEDLYLIYEDEDVQQYLDPLEKDHAVEAEKLKAYIEFAYPFFGFGFWSVCDIETHELIGRCGLGVQEIDEEVYVEAGYLIRSDRRNEGLAYEAMTAVLEYAEEDLGIERTAVVIYEGNIKSVNLAEKLGYRYKKDIFRNGQRRQLYVR